MSILFRDGERVETSEREPLKLGDTVKVILPTTQDTIQEECPWADVVELLPDGRWQGRIVNYLMYARGYDYGDVVTFERMSDGSRWWWQPTETASPKAVN